MRAKIIASRSTCCTGSAQSRNERGDFIDHISWPSQKQIVTRTRPSQHARSRYTSFERARLALRHRFIEAIELGVRRGSAYVVRAGKDGQSRESNLRELAAARRDCLTSRCLSTRLPTFSLRKGKRRTSDRGRCGRWAGKTREVFVEFPGHVVGVSV